MIGRQIDWANRIHLVNELHGANLEEGNQHQENCQWKNQPNEPKYKPVKERPASSKYILSLCGISLPDRSDLQYFIVVG